MKELTRTNDAVLISWLMAALKEAGIRGVLLDTHTSVLEGSVAAIPRRIMVEDRDYYVASRLLAEADQLAAREGHDGEPGG